MRLADWRPLFGMCLLATTLSAGDWPHWRGPDRDEVSKETGLLKEWPKEGPPRVWLNNDVGIGYSGFAIVNGKLFTMGAREDTEFLICLDANDGKERWSARIGSLLENGYGDGPRGTPSVEGDRVYAMGGQGTLICAQVANGEVVWSKTMSALGGRKPGWGYCESILVDGDRVVCTPGGRDGAITAFDKRTGEVQWRSTDVSDGAQYASVVPVEHNGQRQYIQLFTNTLVAVAADSGKLLWKTDWPGRTAVIPTPIFHDGHVFITSGYGVGCKLVKIGEENKVETVYENKNMTNHHGGVIRIGDHLYGYSDGKGWVCMEFKSGEIVWSERRALGKGCLTSADAMLYCQGESDGEIVLIDASPAGWKEHGRFQLEAQSSRRSQRGKIWTHPTVCNGKLFLRDQEFLSCYDVKAK